MCLAAQREFRSRGVEMPACFDDLFESLDHTQIAFVVRVLEDVAAAGQQIIVFCENRLTQDNMVRQKWFDISAQRPSIVDVPLQVRERFVPLPENQQNIRTEFVPQRPIPYTTRLHRNDVPPSRVAPADIADRSTTNLSVVDQSSLLRNAQLLDAEYLLALNEAGIHTIADLLDIDPDLLDTELTRRGISSDLIDRWQSQVWLKIAIPELSAYDTLLLVISGIRDPNELEEFDDKKMLDRIRDAWIQTNDTNDFDGTRYDPIRFENWRNSFGRNRSLWRNHQRYLRRGRQMKRWHSSPTLDRQRNDRLAGGANKNLSGRIPRNDLSHHSRSPLTNGDRDRDLPARQNTERAVERTHSRPDNNGSALPSPRNERSANRQPSNTKIKFYLNLTDDLEAAPSIGPKTAERFEKIGIVSVGDFLDADAESMADELGYKRIKGEDINQWQQQTRLVCQIPNLRGHDAQLLVACDITDPDELAAMDPEELFKIIGPFAKSKEGVKIIRSSKKPDLQEMIDWISWAGSTRSLQAA
jgi:predicted flap endonuclease-1-like 5' DNA nuclease